MSGFTVHDDVPHRRYARGSPGYDRFVTAATEHAGAWVRLDELGHTDQPLVERRRSALCNHLRARGLAYRTAVRSEDGRFFVFLQAPR